MHEGATVMTLTVEATYENGTLKLAQPLPFAEHEKVRVTVQAGTTLAEQTAGMIGWKGDAETFERILTEAAESEELP
jgi:predicted DNA-binding antitoxin AbrB/MazE fold protein